jgi:hypothetical protein
MTNRKNDEKLKVPKWYKLYKYDGLAAFTTPLEWLLQFAFRIDLRTFWGEISCGYIDRLSTENHYFQGDLAFNAICLSLKERPILPVEQLVAQFREVIDFPTVSLVKRGLVPVRPMTFADILLAYASLPSEKRELIRHVIDCIDRDVPYPVNAIRFAQYYETNDRLRRSRRQQVSNEFEVISRYRRSVLDRLLQLKWRDSRVHVLNSILSSEWDRANEDFLNEPIFDHTSREFTNYFALDANTTVPRAKKSLDTLIRKSQSKKRNGKQVGKLLFESWQKNGILPYIDLNLYAEYKASTCQNPNIAISDYVFAGAIFQPNDESGDSKKVSEATRPTAEALMDPESAIFRQLLSAVRS